MFGITDKQEPIYYEGVIADNEDPEFWGRVRVQIIGRQKVLMGKTCHLQECYIHYLIH